MVTQKEDHFISKKEDHFISKKEDHFISKKEDHYDDCVLGLPDGRTNDVIDGSNKRRWRMHQSLCSRLLKFI